MAAHSGGIDWAKILPLLSNSSENVSKSDTQNLVKTIIQSENEILDHDAAHKQFFDSFVVLAAEYLTNQVTTLSQTQLPQFSEAATVLIRYILQQHQDVQAPNKPSILLMALKVLCEGRKDSGENGTGTGSGSSIISASSMKYLKYPEAHGKSSCGGSSSSGVGVSSGGSGSEKDSPKSEMKRSRSDLSTVILQQLTTPLGAGAFTFATLSEEQIDCTDMFVKSNIQCLQATNGGDTLYKWCCNSLATLAKYRAKYEECTIQGKPLYLPITTTEASAVKSNLPQIESDISNLLLAVSLPVLDLCPSKIALRSTCGHRQDAHGG